MQLYKALTPIQALSFDLDDTLYNNSPVIAAAEKAMLAALAEHAPQSNETDSDFWWQQRLLLAKIEPEIRHDIGRWRLLGIEAGLLELGLPRPKAKSVAQQGYDAFIEARTRISLNPEIGHLLTKLTKRYRLIAITNGNACIHKMGVGELFQFSLQSGRDGRMKPYPDMFITAAKRLNVKPEQILHIGDSHRADVMGALGAGCQAAWLDHYQSSITVLPHIHLKNILEISNIMI